MTDSEGLVAVRNQTGTSFGKWHIFQAEILDDVHHSRYPVCGHPNNLDELKGGNSKTDYVEVGDLEELAEMVDGKFGDICKKCREYIAGEYSGAQKVEAGCGTDSYGTGRCKVDQWREKSVRGGNQ